MRLLVFSFCLLYAGEIPHADADGEIGELFEGHKKWTRTGRVLHCRAAKISKAYFPEEDRIWISLYRLIICDPAREKYHLSGIALLDDENDLLAPCYEPRFVPLNRDRFIVPQDRDTATLGEAPENSEKALHVLGADVLQFLGDCPSGIPIHARCWDFIELMIGSDAADHLDLLVQVLRAGFPEAVPSRVGFELNDRPGFGVRRVYSAGDPFRIPAVRDLIRQSKSRAKNALVGKKDGTRNGFLSLLPPEIQYIILDQLSRKCFANFREAGLKMHDEYWRSRVPKNLIFELQDIAATDLVDWEFLCLEIEEMIEGWDLRSLEARRYLIESLHRRKRAFRRSLKEKQSATG